MADSITRGEFFVAVDSKGVKEILVIISAKLGRSSLWSATFDVLCPSGSARNCVTPGGKASRCIHCTQNCDVIRNETRASSLGRSAKRLPSGVMHSTAAKSRPENLSLDTAANDSMSTSYQTIKPESNESQLVALKFRGPQCSLTFEYSNTPSKNVGRWLMGRFGRVGFSEECQSANSSWI